MPTVTLSRPARLKERLIRLEHDRYREHRHLDVLAAGADPAEPVVVRKARALALVLREMPVHIQDDELIVGGRTLYGGRDALRFVSHQQMFTASSRWAASYYPHYLTDQELGALNASAPNSRPGAGVRPAAATGHAAVGYQRILSLGFGGLRTLAKQSAARLRAENPPDLARRLAFLEAADIALAGATGLVRRYEQLARTLAATSDDPARRAELSRIAGICEQVAEHPPRDFHEALQLFFFARVISMVESYICMPLGRFDQYLYPYLAQDLAAGRLTRADALELLECLFVKLNEEVDVSTTDDCLRIMVSGQDAEGHDVTNELSYLCLEAAVDLHLASPKVGVRLHRGTPREFLMRCVEVARLGIGGLPEIYNDEGIISTLVDAGMPLEHARDYAHDGCSEITLPGRSDFYPIWTKLRFLQCLESFLAEGAEYGTFGDLLAAYKARATREMQEAAALGNERDRILGEFSPAPFISATFEGCLERGLDKTWGGTIYNETGMLGMELPNTANALAAVKKLVYEERRLSLAELRAALASDFADAERLRLMLVNRAPKYGNDDDYVDAIAEDLASHYIRTVRGFSNPRGGRFRAGFYDFSNFIIGAKEIGATPDGRKAGGYISGNLSAMPGTDRNGPTALVRSACKVMRLHPELGAMLDIRLHPSAVRGANGLEQLAALVGGYMDLGGLALQFNVVDGATLRAAQREPEKYRDLLVRVWGFSAYFVQLSPDFQEHIIARTEHGL
ncbi:MAG: hypothetical protein HY331_13380 [Chloroflexi bacterium]|nr:hypothetical protein [Chloroflexota bacterium]